jgi:hypothetical protein
MKKIGFAAAGRGAGTTAGAVSATNARAGGSTIISVGIAKLRVWFSALCG